MTIGSGSEKTETMAEIQEINNSIEEAVMRVSGGVLVAMSAVSGLWAMAALIGGLLAVGGPFALAQSWFGAVLGL